MPESEIKQKRRPNTTSVIEPPPAATAPELLTGINIGGEPGQLDVNFCTNHTCSNFGVGASGEAGKRAYKFTRPRDDWGWHLTCRACGQLQRMFNNTAADTVFLHILKNHLPHEYCQRKVCVRECDKNKCKKEYCVMQRCDNYRFSFYEHFGRRYNIKTNSQGQQIFQARCKGNINGERCGAVFSAGQPLGLHAEQEHASEYMTDYGLFMRVICNDNGPRSAMDILQCSGTNYSTHLKNLAAVSRDVSGHHFMRLLDPRLNFQDAHMHIYTDIVEVPIHTGGRSQRAAKLGYIVTVTDLNSSNCILAATPLFFPDDRKTRELRTELLTNCEDELNLAECYRPHAHLYFPGEPKSLSKNTDTGESGETTYPPMGLNGFFDA